VICVITWHGCLLADNDYANPVAASNLPFQKPVFGNSGSAFCSAAFSVRVAQLKPATFSQENAARLTAKQLAMAT